jgi:hypothetical protein
MGYVARMGAMKNGCTVLVGEPEGCSLGFLRKNSRYVHSLMSNFIIFTSSLKSLGYFNQDVADSGHSRPTWAENYKER